MNESTLEQARNAKTKMASTLTTLGEAGGVGITRIGGGYGLKVNLTHALTDQDKAALPLEIDGVPVRFEVVGQIRKQTARI